MRGFSPNPPKGYTPEIKSSELTEATWMDKVGMIQMPDIARLHPIWAPTSLSTMTQHSLAARGEEQHSVCRLMYALKQKCIRELKSWHPVKCTFLGHWANNPILRSEGVAKVLIIVQMGLPNSYRLINSPTTRSCMRSVFEKQIVRRTSRLIRVRRLICLLSMKVFQRC